MKLPRLSLSALCIPHSSKTFSYATCSIAFYTFLKWNLPIALSVAQTEKTLAIKSEKYCKISFNKHIEQQV